MNLLSAWAATYAHSHPHLKLRMRKAHMRELPSRFVLKCINSALFVGVTIGVITFFFVDRFDEPFYWIPITFVVTAMATFFFTISTPLGIIRRRGREIDEEVLFVGRYLLVKLESGQPLYNALIDCSKTRGISAKYLKEIVDDITAGKPIEQAIEYAWEFNSSEKFKRILFQILSALKTGTELAPVLRTTLKSLTYQQVLEVKEYGKKLNTYMMFYLIMACILPSLGVTMLVVFSSFIQLELGKSTLFVIIFFLCVVQMMFILIVKSSRPAVNI